MKEEKDNVISIENGLEVIKGSNNILKKKRGGKLPGAGRKPREKALTNYARAVKMLDDSVEYALDSMIRGISSPDPAVSYKCSEFIIKHALLLKKEGSSGEEKISKEDMEVAVQEVMQMIANR